MGKQDTSETTLGEKLRYFRTRAGISQLDLELDIGASQGSLSRIESGKVNPTKETLFKVIQVLGLQAVDAASLFGLDEKPPLPGDIEKVRHQLSNYFSQPTTFAMLIDNYWNVQDVSAGIFEVLPIDREQMMKHIGKNLLEALFDPTIGIAPLLEKKEVLYTYELVLFRNTMATKLEEPWYKDLIERLSKFEEFRKYWAISADKPLNYFPKEARYIYFNVEGKRVKLLSNFTRLNSDPRFELLDYVLV